MIRLWRAVPPCHRHRLKSVEFMAAVLGISPDEELLLRPGFGEGDVHMWKSITKPRGLSFSMNLTVGLDAPDARGTIRVTNR